MTSPPPVQPSLLASLVATYRQSFSPTLQYVISDLPRLLLINLICGVLVTYVMHAGGSFFENWIFSNCIGLCAYTLITGLKKLIWRGRTPNSLTFYALCCLIAPVSFVLGTLIAATLFSYPLPHVLALQWNVASSFIAVTSLASLLASWSFWNKSKMAELAAHAAAIEKQAIQAQLQMLQAQIEPHMLFNTLANLQGLIMLDPARAQHMLEQLIIYLRMTLSASRAEQSSLEQEFGLITAYLELLAIRMGQRLSFTLDLPAALRGHRIAPMLLQPLVENAIKHGLEPSISGGHVHVSASSDDACLCLRVQDGGLGLSAVVDESRQHVGNDNIRRRLQVLYGAAATLTLTPALPTGVCAELRLPFALTAP
ncbi:MULTISPECIES: sensor histidine kinase [unclassified Undibacterium]|uniref:sensor histidine kinase n=1 Tax=unclassified Undibacterium TaxID=2630295 RepID=UPI002AC8E3DF|nr:MULTISPECIES: histidine kinase [unclassified Undibacterium]MEB0139816.1 histidine kinase [Undibacterium sp. CCC2.1]MEB0170476.1 histidine kinase [Undibacterium sp. CCC1.1]MEB0174417.1 histidine kinase [Undibacterium sp. CCC3.4]MEB0213786.1 histidine kinase [Undibacterium sp. 5I2]WPX43948.1 histidine kinase [Undibacterium sp. CCC3.4]